MMQENKPLVTVVTITFNLLKAGREKTFRQCLESVHDQTYKNIEHIVVDGASKDGSLRLIKEYADKGWIEYISELDNGIYDAMNKGVNMARGKYVSFLNSDDFYHDKMGIESTVKALEMSGADFSYAPVLMLNKDGSVLKNHAHSAPKISNTFIHMPFCHQSMFTKRSVMVNEGIFDANFKSVGDYDFVMRLCLKKYKSVFVDLKFVTYRLGGLSDFNRRQSIQEVSYSYYKNFRKLFPITEEQCSRIYYSSLDVFPSELAKKLADFKPYFDYEECLKAIIEESVFKKRLRQSFSIVYPGFKFVLFSPVKFLRKYLNLLVGGRLRQSLRRIYYLVRLRRLE